MMDLSDRGRLLSKECTDLGEVKVRKRLSQGLYVGQNKSYVEGWLAQIEAKRSNKERAANASHANMQTKLAREAADAARDSAAAARDQAEAAREANVIAQRANVISTIALVAAAIAIAVSIIGLFLR